MSEPPFEIGPMIDVAIDAIQYVNRRCPSYYTGKETVRRVAKTLHACFNLYGESRPNAKRGPISKTSFGLRKLRYKKSRKVVYHITARDLQIRRANDDPHVFHPFATWESMAKLSTELGKLGGPHKGEDVEKVDATIYEDRYGSPPVLAVATYKE
tara:strand:+ start:212 stop:676 length:465 start_codon:yes stop_codon:yes gene_type:complete